jgi:hypothetical protein
VAEKPPKYRMARKERAQREKERERERLGKTERVMSIQGLISGFCWGSVLIDFWVKFHLSLL